MAGCEENKRNNQAVIISERLIYEWGLSIKDTGEGSF